MASMTGWTLSLGCAFAKAWSRTGASCRLQTCSSIRCRALDTTPSWSSPRSLWTGFLLSCSDICHNQPRQQGLRGMAAAMLCCVFPTLLTGVLPNALMSRALLSCQAGHLMLYMQMDLVF